VPAVARPADRERSPAPPACQQVKDDSRQQLLAQTSSMRDWTSKPGRCDAFASHPLVTPSPRRGCNRGGASQSSGVTIPNSRQERRTRLRRG
jgi:hypothetical protein